MARDMTKEVTLEELSELIKQQEGRMEDETRKPKIIAYDYLFNYFGKDSFKEKIISGASIQIAFRVYKNGNEVKFTEEPMAGESYLCDILCVSFDKDALYLIKKDTVIEKLFCTMYGWDKIEIGIIGFSLDYYTKIPDDLRDTLPDCIKNLPCSTNMEVSEEEFKKFLKGHLADFDISDNVSAQVPSVSFVESEHKFCRNIKLFTSICQ